MRVTRTVARIIVVTMVVATVPHPAGAECIRLWKDFADAKRRASLVFSGTVTETKPDPDGSFVAFAIDRVWKGSAKRRLVSPLFVSLDSFRFQKGTMYLVFADRHRSSSANPQSLRVPTTSEPVFEVSECSATRTIAEAGEALVQLGPGSK